MTLKQKCKLIDTALSWHGGGESALYQFASGRTVLDFYHRNKLLVEIQKNIDWCSGQSRKTPTAELGQDLKNLRKLFDFVDGLTIGVESHSYDQQEAYWDKESGIFAR